MSAVLERILSDKRARLARGEFAPVTPVTAKTDGARFVAALREPGVRIVAEFKARSPSAGELVPGADGKLETFALAYRRGHAAAISVVAEQDHFGGRPEWVTRAKRISGLPVLMKDFVLSERQVDFAVSLGADAILLLVRALDDAELAHLRRAASERGLAAVVEAHGEGEIARAAAVEPDVVGVNSRDLATFETDVATLEPLASRIPDGPVRLAESGISSRDDVQRLAAAGWQAFLVGEMLLRAEEPEEALRELAR
ncbi:MAG TPA: indole-3-glycerol-phosphate synthase [Thermoanaerobaculia bacterium]|jgi:indole-3-glycerol phosphate synthase|nr:indole-3-glycerol-phosphate synthase [Thermoanaerobaculia bacterium]HEV8608562.1 indole-3-glycerol-phosphate synthase [Thermoanaerobaculia bacterium]